VKSKITLFLLGCLCLPGIATFPALGSDTEKRIEQPVKQSIDIRQVTQEKEQQWRLEQDKLTARLERLQQEQVQLQSQRAELHEQAEGMRTRLAHKEKQLADIEEISHRIRPFLAGLVTELEMQLTDGLPFLTAERRQRIERLKTVMADPEISTSEKYRKVMEALQVEAEYGFTIEVYQETIELEGKTMLVDIFRLGRLSLFYLSLDRKYCGFYNIASGGWQGLPTSHLREIQAAVDIATKRRTADLLTLPLGRIVTQ
jgi:septal ring factor EnvC (AmiA/AmiB activator)